MTRPTARELIRTEAAEFGWVTTETPLADMFDRDGESIITYWLESDPLRLGAGVARITAGLPIGREVDRSPLSLVTARRWLGSKWV